MLRRWKTDALRAAQRLLDQHLRPPQRLPMTDHICWRLSVVVLGCVFGSPATCDGAMSLAKHGERDAYGYIGPALFDAALSLIPFGWARGCRCSIGSR